MDDISRPVLPAENTAEKQRGRPFEAGQSGNPKGRPKGSRNKTTLAAENLLEGEADAITKAGREGKRRRFDCAAPLS